MFDRESKNIYFICNNRYIIAKIECWPVFSGLAYPNFGISIKVSIVSKFDCIDCIQI